MCIAAVNAIAETAEDNGINQNYIVPTMDEWAVFPKEAAAVATAAVNEGIARVKLSYDEFYEKAEEIIKRARARRRC